MISRRTMEAIARFGYLTHGIIYLVVGSVAAVAAFDWRVQTTDVKGALLTILSRPLGSVLLAIVAAGLVAFSIWSLLQCLADTERIGARGEAFFVRAGFLGASVGHLLLCFTALNLIFGWQPASVDAEAQIRDWTTWAFARSWGRLALGAIAILVIAGGVAVAKNGWHASFVTRLKDNPRVRKVAVPVGRLGLIAQGSTFILGGGFLLFAVFRDDPMQARGLAGILGTLREQPPYGWILLAVAAFGLIIYGIYGLFEAAFRRVEPPKQMPSAKT